MRELEDGSIHLILTSPPYWQLKDYGSAGQIGFCNTYEEYINNLNLVWSECHRTLHDGCRLCINIGDQFARAAHYGRYKVIPIRTEIIRFCETIGFDYMGAIIWQKVTTTNTSGGGSVMGSFPHPRNGVVKLDYEFILLFKKHGKAPVASAALKERSKLTTEEWNSFFSGHWNFPGERQSAHLAALPVELPRRLIRMFSMVGDCVLDPFLGSGTTSRAAAETERNSFGYEVNADYLPVIETSLAGLSVEVEQRTREDGDFDERLERLPYRFHDPVRCERRRGARPLPSYGSKISGTEETSLDELHSVTQISAPDSIVLDTGQKVHLIGIKALKRTKRRAEAHLEQLVKGRKVYLRFDDHARKANGAVWAYLYLQNRTPINRHLIRSGLVGVDTSRDYRFKKDFLQERARARP